METRLIDLVFPGDTNHHGTLFGGAGLAAMDKAAYIAAARHARADFVTASCDRIDFSAPAHVGEIIEVSGRVVRAGRRSLTVEVDLVAEAPISGERRLCTRGRFNMVAAAREASVPPLPDPQPVSPDPLAAATGPLGMMELVFPDQCSHRQSLFGGYALAAMGKAAFVAATRHCRKAVVMAASSGMDFKVPIHVGELMEITAEVVRTGTSSMQVAVRTFGVDLLGGRRWPVAEGGFVMVALDEVNRPTPALER